MKIFFQDPSVTFLGLTNYTDEESAIRAIELAARNCYQSKPSETFEEAIGFVQRLGQRGHTSTYSHVQITFKIDKEYFKEIWWDLTFTRYYRWFDILPEDDNIYLSGSMRIWFESLKYYVTMIAMGISKNDPINFVYQVLVRDLFPNLFAEYVDLFKDVPIVPTITAITDSNKVPDELKRFMFYVVTDRAVTMEWDRHTTLGISEESQRYMDYTKYGATFITQPELQSDPKDEDMFKAHVIRSAELYELFRQKYKPEIARAVLPNCTRVRSVFSGIMPFWKHFIDMRTSDAAHPHIRCLANQVKAIITSYNWFDFNFEAALDLKTKVEEQKHEEVQAGLQSHNE